MPDLPTPEVKALLEAIDTFGENPPRDLPEGTIEQLKGVGQQLRGYSGVTELDSPGEKEAKQFASSDSAVPYPKAATGPDQPSPGQRELAKIAEIAQSATKQAA